MKGLSVRLKRFGQQFISVQLRVSSGSQIIVTATVMEIHAEGAAAENDEFIPFLY